MNQAEERKKFNTGAALALARQLKATKSLDGFGSARFAYFTDADRFVIVAGEQEGHDTDLALAYGLTYRGDKRLVLVLPEGCAFSTLQRAPWFQPEARPEVWLHDGKRARKIRLPSQRATVEELKVRLGPESPAQELRKAFTATYLGQRTQDVYELAEWAGQNPLLDPAHRQGERAWHCMGQKLLSIRGISGGLAVRAGIHYSDGSKVTHPVATGQPISAAALRSVIGLVEAGVEARLTGTHAKPDEHWLQAVIRRTPSLVGIEQPALRELPAWRPRCGPLRSHQPPSAYDQWGRGFIDLLGLDAHGDVRIAETKLADNRDDRMVLQGLDYYVWSRAYDEAVRDRLGAPPRSRTEIHYVVGTAPNGKAKVSSFTAAQAEGLDPRIPWRFQVVRDWFVPDPRPPSPACVRLLPARQLPQVAAVPPGP